MAFISLKNVYKDYYINKAKQQVLLKLCLEVGKGESISIIGPSGSGKSTLLKIIGFLDEPSSGTIVINGFDCSKITETKRTYYRRKLIGFVFQSYNLLPDFTALENVLLAQYILGEKKKRALKKAESLFSILDIKEKCHIYPSQLSGGEQQRVAIARSLINNPELILADEPTGNLDAKNTRNVIEILSKISKEHNITTIIVTHDINIAKETDKTYILKEGRLEQQN